MIYQKEFLIVKIPHTILFICLNDNHILDLLLTSWNICNSKRSSRNGRILLGRVSKKASFWKLIFSLGWNLKASRYPPKTRKICQLLREQKITITTQQTKMTQNPHLNKIDKNLEFN